MRFLRNLFFFSPTSVLLVWFGLLTFINMPCGAYDYDIFYSGSSHHSSSSQQRNEPEHIISNPRNERLSISPETAQPSPEETSEGNDEEQLLVRSKNGYIKGRKFYTNHIVPKYNSRNQTAPKKQLNAWLGIPYAEKPIGNLRFKRPVPIRNWRGIYHATKLQNTCYQNPDKIFPGFWGTELWNPNTPVSEDCLYLNVWTPNPRPIKRPVMVWIYGGSFLSGTSTLEIYDPKVIVAETDVIFVSLNYRVSIFGFLFLDHIDAPGNMGLLDQNMALRWVYDNIEAFGGDPTKITIVGESAGSASVSLHLLSPLSQPLFKSAIMQSGGFLADWATLERGTALKRYTEMLHAMGCNQTLVADLLSCARAVSPSHALDATDEYFYTRADHGIMQFPFLPVVDHYFLPGEPLTLVNQGRVKKCPILLGVNKDEANWFYIYAFPEYRNLSKEPVVTYELYKTFLHSLFHFYPQFPTTSNKKVIDAITQRYSHWDNVHNRRKNIEYLDDAAADFHFVCPALDMASTFAMNNQDVFFYYFTQRASNHLWPDYFGVLHADEIQFTFGQPLYLKYNFTRQERIFTRKLLKYWTNFVRYDNPNGLRNHAMNHTASLKTHIEPWPKFRILTDSKNDKQKAYLELNAEKNTIGYNLRADYCSFWGSYLPKLLLEDVKECSCAEECAQAVANVKSGCPKLLTNLYILSTILLTLL